MRRGLDGDEAGRVHNRQMKTEDFMTRHAKAVAALWGRVARRYGIAEREFAERLSASAARSLSDGPAEAAEFFAHVKAEELCLAIACEQGDDEAWRDFEASYRHTMLAGARALTKDEAEAEDLVQSVMGELYGVRVIEGRRASKLAHYSGRGSLGGWLRAVIYQAFIDRKRQTARFEQVEEAADLERLAANSKVALSAPSARPDEVKDARLQRATEEAMAQAFAELEARDRLLLQYYYFDELTLREIGALMGVHEATISRWLARAQRQVRRKTEDLLRRNCGLHRAEIAECLHLAASAEVDVRQMIGEAKSASADRAS
jgi:RNA polymerase sigma-70 factor (ECF subfamily)